MQIIGLGFLITLICRMFYQADWTDNDNGKQLEKALFSQSCGIADTDEARENVISKRNHKTPARILGTKSIDIKSGQVSKKRKNKPCVKKTKAGATDSSELNNVSTNCHSVQLTHLVKGDDLIDGKTEEGTRCVVENSGVSRSDNWKRRKLVKMMNKTSQSRSELNTKGVDTALHQPASVEKQGKRNDSNFKSRSTLLRDRVTLKLQSSKFRFINEQLYTRSSHEASRIFRTNPKAFEAYHAGFTQQVAKWPINPLDKIISFIQKRPSKWVIGDFGCGDAQLAASVKNTVYSFDLVACNDRVTVADISKVPLPDSSLDVAVFCLSLMGTNFTDFLIEANRTLKLRGLLKIAEVTSRFTSVTKFLNLLKALGFELDNQDREDTHFFAFDFRKVRKPQVDFEALPGLLKPCVYKKR